MNTIIIKKTLRLLLIAGGGLVIIITLWLSNYHYLSSSEQERYCDRYMKNILGLLILYSLEQKVDLSPATDVHEILNTYEIINQCPITQYPYRIIIDDKEKHIISIIEEPLHNMSKEGKKEFSRELPLFSHDIDAANR